MKNFDDSARDWDSDPLKVERARRVAASISDSIALSPWMSAFEYGCGTGLLSFFLQPALGHIVLADVSQGMLDVLAEKIATTGLTNMLPICLDLVTDPLPAERFDLIYSLMTLHHISDINLVIGRFFHLLKPGGFLCIADLDAEDGTFHTNGSTDVHHGFERNMFQKQLENAGFLGVKFSTAFEIRKMAGGIEKSFPVFLMTAYRDH